MSTALDAALDAVETLRDEALSDRVDVAAVELAAATLKEALRTAPPTRTLRAAAEHIILLESILGSVWLHGNWRYLTRQMTTEQKEAFADAVEAWNADLNAQDGEVEPLNTDRWWRD